MAVGPTLEGDSRIIYRFARERSLVSMMFIRASFLPIEAEQHQTLRMPLRATGSSSAIALERRFLKRDVHSERFSSNSAAYFLTAFSADAERSCDTYVPPSNSSKTVNNGIFRL